jgi:hypothetical protein
MEENEILTEIRRTRDEHARECRYDVHILFERMRAETAQLETEGWKVVSPAVSETTSLLREDPPSDLR